jgi:hypothetical protein
MQEGHGYIAMVRANAMKIQNDATCIMIWFMVNGYIVVRLLVLVMTPRECWINTRSIWQVQLETMTAPASTLSIPQSQADL